MSTGASIEVPFGYDKYYVKSGGYPDEVGPLLTDVVENAMEEAEGKYDDPGENLVEQLELEFNDMTEGHNSTMSVYRNESCSYYYKITEDGDVMYRSFEHEDWERYND